MATIGIDFKIKSIQVDNKTVKMQIWHSVGRERFRPVRPAYFRGAHGIILVYDITNADSFKSIPNWVEQCEQYSCSNVTIMIAGNKCDLKEQRQVSEAEGRDFAFDNNLLWMETSAKTGTNVDEMFITLILSIKQKLRDKMAMLTYNEKNTMS